MIKQKTHIVALGAGTGFRECIEAECEETGEINYFLISDRSGLVKIEVTRFIELKENISKEKKELSNQRWVY